MRSGVLLVDQHRHTYIRPVQGCWSLYNVVLCITESSGSISERHTYRKDVRNDERDNPRERLGDQKAAARNEYRALQRVHRANAQGEDG